MPIPDYQSLMLSVLRHSRSGETSVADVEDKIANELGLSAAEREQLLPSGKQRLLNNRIHWAKWYMQKAGLLNAPRRGRFSATAAGLDLLNSNPRQINVETLKRYPAFLSFYEGSKEALSQPLEANLAASRTQTSSSTPEEIIGAAFAAHKNALREELLERILASTPSFFEQVIVTLLVAMGYGGTYKEAARQLGRTGDGGVDGVINEDRLGLDRVYVQAKRYRPENVIGRPDVQAFIGSIVGLGASKGVFVTTSGFSRQAIDFVKHLPQRVILVDGPSLTDLMIEYQVGVRTSQTIEFKRLDEDFFAEDI